MSRSVCHTVTSQEAGKRLDQVCGSPELYATRSAAARAIEEGNVLVNGKNLSKSYLVALGDTIVCALEDERPAGVIKGQAIPLDIRYEDDDLIVLSKQAGLVCHPSLDHEDMTLVNALVYRYGDAGLCHVQGDDDRPGIVHRLDRDTSGLMLAAKTDEAGYLLMDEIRMRSVDRHYIALVHGLIAHDSGMIDAPIARSLNERTRMAVRESPSSRDAVTTFQVLQRFQPGANDNGYTLIECKLFTGRTHQIRVHMQYTHHPVVGDPVYDAHSPKKEEASLGLNRQFLHSYHLGFTHPMTDSEMTFSDGLPRDLQTALQSIEPRGKGLSARGEEVMAQLRQAPVQSVEPLDPFTGY